MDTLAQQGMTEAVEVGDSKALTAMGPQTSNSDATHIFAGKSRRPSMALLRRVGSHAL